MSHWSDGYLTQIDYINYYSHYLNPNNLTVPFLMHNLAIPEIKTCCELGFGQGHCIVVHSCATDSKWYGTDFLPNQVLKAKKLNQLADDEQAQATLFDESFAEFCQRDDLPEFDMIALHGIWSWISDENRQIIIDFIRRKLKVGGVVYVSYNLFPAWHQVLPLKHLLTAQYELTPDSWSVEKRTTTAFEKTKELVALSPALQANFPLMMQTLSVLENQTPAYIAHEYLNEHLTPMYFDEIAALLDQAKLTFACSANYLDNADETMLMPEQIQYLQSIDNPILRQTIKQSMFVKTFRGDYWVKGAEKLSSSETQKRWRQVRVVLAIEPEQINPEIDSRVKIQIDPKLLHGILAVLSDYQIHNVGEILDALTQQYDRQEIIWVLALLISENLLQIAQSNEVIDKVRERCQKFNQAILDRLFDDDATRFLISPVTAWAIKFGYVDLLFVKALSENIPPDHQVEWIWQYLQANGRQLLDGNRQAMDKEQTMALLNEMAVRHQSYQNLIRSWQLV